SRYVPSRSICTLFGLRRKFSSKNLNSFPSRVRISSPPRLFTEGEGEGEGEGEAVFCGEVRHFAVFISVRCCSAVICGVSCCSLPSSPLGVPAPLEKYSPRGPSGRGYLEPLSSFRFFCWM